jgi:hypothetical protein
MLRIGIAASKMAKGNLLTYNFFVVLISCLFSLIIFLVGGCSILVIVFLISLGLHAVRHSAFHTGWVHMFKICLIILAAVTAIFNLTAIARNIQTPKNKI